jgi:hypothetical protein
MPLKEAELRAESRDVFILDWISNQNVSFATVGVQIFIEGAFCLAGQAKCKYE